MRWQAVHTMIHPNPLTVGAAVLSYELSVTARKDPFASASNPGGDRANVTGLSALFDGLACSTVFKCSNPPFNLGEGAVGVSEMSLQLPNALAQTRYVVHNIQIGCVGNTRLEFLLSNEASGPQLVHHLPH